MLTIEDLNLDQHLSVYTAVYFAEEVLPIFEKEYPNDSRPRNAIDAAKAWLNNPCKETAAAANDDAAANAAAYTTANAAYGAALAAANAAYAAVYADYAIYTSNNAVAAAYSAVANAAHAANAIQIDDKELYIHHRIVKLLPYILEYKIKHNQPFKSPRKVFEYLSEEDREKFIFNLDILC